MTELEQAAEKVRKCIEECRDLRRECQEAYDHARKLSIREHEFATYLDEARDELLKLAGYEEEK